MKKCTTYLWFYNTLSMTRTVHYGNSEKDMKGPGVA